MHTQLSCGARVFIFGLSYQIVPIFHCVFEQGRLWRECALARVRLSLCRSHMCPGPTFYTRDVSLFHYNHATSNLAIYPQKTSQDKLQEA